MTQTLPARETLTRPIAHRRYTPGGAIYDCNATAIIRPAEGLILDTTGEIPAVDVPLAHLFQEPPTVPVPPVEPPAPEKLMRPGRTIEYFQDGPRGHIGAHRPPPWPRWADRLIGAGVASVAWSVLGLAVLAVIR